MNWLTQTYWSKFRTRAALVDELWRPSNALLFMRILGLIVLSPVLLRLSLPRLFRLLEPKSTGKTPARPRQERIVRYTEALLSHRGPLPRRSCLRRAITLYYFLSREGAQLEVCFGVAPSNGNLDGHCWLVRDGEPFLESGDPLATFTPMYTFPQAPLCDSQAETARSS